MTQSAHHASWLRGILTGEWLFTGLRALVASVDRRQTTDDRR